MKWLAGCVVCIALAAACTLFDEDPPDDSCETDLDCFRAQGELCNRMTKRCEVRDAGVDAP